MKFLIFFVFSIWVSCTDVWMMPEASRKNERASYNGVSNFRPQSARGGKDAKPAKTLTHYHTFLAPEQPTYFDFSGIKNSMYQVQLAINTLEQQAELLETRVHVGPIERFRQIGTETVFEIEFSAMELAHLSKRVSQHAHFLQVLGKKLRDIHTGVVYPSTQAPSAVQEHDDVLGLFPEQPNERSREPVNDEEAISHVRILSHVPNADVGQEDTQFDSFGQRPHPEEIPRITVYTDYMPRTAGDVYASQHPHSSNGPIIVCTNVEDYKYLKVFAMKMMQYLSDPNERTSCAKELFPMFHGLKQKLAIHRLTLPKNTPLKCVHTPDYLVINSRFSVLSGVLRPFYENNFSDFQVRRLEARRKCSVLLEELQQRPFDFRVPEFRYVPPPNQIHPPSPPPCPPNAKKCSPPTRADVPAHMQGKR